MVTSEPIDRRVHRCIGRQRGSTAGYCATNHEMDLGGDRSALFASSVTFDDLAGQHKISAFQIMEMISSPNRNNGPDISVTFCL